MAEDPIEKDYCIICGKETDRIEQFRISQNDREDIPICAECRSTTSMTKIFEAIKKYIDERDGDEINKALAKVMKKKGYEHYIGPTYQGEEVRHFIKDGILVTIIVNHSPDEEIIESIKDEGE